MSDLVTPAPAADPKPQAGDEQPTEPIQPKAEALTPTQLRAELTAANSEAAATRKKLRDAEARIAAAEKDKADAEAKRLAEQGEYKALYEKAVAEAQAAADRLALVERDAMRKDAAQAAGIPALWQRLQGDTAEALAEDAAALAALMQPAQPANGQPARQPTPPTPQPQGANGLTPDERRQKARPTF